MNNELQKTITINQLLSIYEYLLFLTQHRIDMHIFTFKDMKELNRQF